MGYWLAVGPVENWKIGVKEKIWAVSPSSSKRWEQIKKGDMVFFYATTPVKGLIGTGIVARTDFSESPFWPQEKQRGESLWPYRILFERLKVLPHTDWKTKRYSPDRRGIVFQVAFQPISEDRAKQWLAAM